MIEVEIGFVSTNIEYDLIGPKKINSSLSSFDRE